MHAMNDRASDTRTLLATEVAQWAASFVGDTFTACLNSHDSLVSMPFK